MSHNTSEGSRTLSRSQVRGRTGNGRRDTAAGRVAPEGATAQQRDTRRRWPTRTFRVAVASSVVEELASPLPLP